jgi:transmembrane sensor
VKRPAPNPVESAASIWAARHALGTMTPADQEDFENWYQTDPHHRAVFDRVRQVLGRVEDAGPFVQATHERVLASEARRRALKIGGALCVPLLFFGVWTNWPADLQTGRGEMASFTLADGSRVSLDAHSSVDVEMDGATRRLRLLKGRIHVATAHEGRPFSVVAAGREVVDIGTEFDVGLSDGGANTFVTQGQVVVKGKELDLALSAGEGARWAEGSDPVMRDVGEGRDTLAWRQGEIVFHKRPLGEVIAMLDRYSRKRLWLADSAAGRRLVSGAVHIRDVDRALAAIARSQGLTTQDWGVVVILK